MQVATVERDAPGPSRAARGARRQRGGVAAALSCATVRPLRRCNFEPREGFTLTALALRALGWGNLVGDVTPNNDYDTYVYTIYGDSWADLPAHLCVLCHDAIWGSRQRKSVLLSR